MPGVFCQRLGSGALQWVFYKIKTQKDIRLVKQNGEALEEDLENYKLRLTNAYVGVKLTGKGNEICFRNFPPFFLPAKKTLPLVRVVFFFSNKKLVLDTRDLTALGAGFCLERENSNQGLFNYFALKF